MVQIKRESLLVAKKRLRHTTTSASSLSLSSTNILISPPSITTRTATTDAQLAVNDPLVDLENDKDKKKTKSRIGSTIPKKRNNNNNNKKKKWQLHTFFQATLLTAVIPGLFWARHVTYWWSKYNYDDEWMLQQQQYQQHNAAYANHLESFRLSDSNPNHIHHHHHSKAHLFFERWHPALVPPEQPGHPIYVLTRNYDKHDIARYNGGDMAQIHYCQFPILNATRSRSFKHKHHHHDQPENDKKAQKALEFWIQFSNWVQPLLNQTMFQLSRRYHAGQAQLQQEQQQQQQQQQQQDNLPKHQLAVLTERLAFSKQDNMQQQYNNNNNVEVLMEQELLLQFLEIYAQHQQNDLVTCDYSLYRPTIPKNSDNRVELTRLSSHLKRLQAQSAEERVDATAAAAATFPRIVFTIVAHQDFSMLKHLIHALHQPHHVLIIHVERPRTRAALEFRHDLRKYIGTQKKKHPTEKSNIFGVTFGTIVYSTDSVSLVHWRLLNWMLHDCQFTNFDYYVALDGASFPLWSPQELMEQLTIQQQQPQREQKYDAARQQDSFPIMDSEGDPLLALSPLVWLGPQLHKGKLLGTYSTNTTSSATTMEGRMQQSALLLQRKRVFWTSLEGDVKMTQRLPSRNLFPSSSSPSDDMDGVLIQALVAGGKTHSGNTAVYAQSVVQRMVQSPMVQELFAKSKYAAYCCMEERTWSAALHLIGVHPSTPMTSTTSLQAESALPDLRRHYFPPAVFQTYGGTKPGVCESSKRNAILTTAKTKTKTIQPNNNNLEDQEDRTNTQDWARTDSLSDAETASLPLLCYKLDDATLVHHYRENVDDKPQVPLLSLSRHARRGKTGTSTKDDGMLSCAASSSSASGGKDFNDNTDCDYYFWSNETIHVLRQAKQMGFLFARKFNTSKKRSLALLHDLQGDVW
ncbi:hypothetical protein ACA910_014941 [Epithemia clementina (nom. ined.)]